MIGEVALLVPDYDEAIAWFTGALGFELVEDTDRGEGKRWVRVRPPGAGGTCLLLARAATPEQRQRIGGQAGGRVFLFLHTDDFLRDHQRFRERGVTFLEEPRHEPYGTVAVFQDPWGNRWDLLQAAETSDVRPSEHLDVRASPPPTRPWS
jgi:catechol 2,3-dioxygenase-like lactoylglutathione lyase family enzyme